MSNFIKTRRDGWFEPALVSPHCRSPSGKSPFYAAAAGEKIAELCELSPADLVSSGKKAPFLKGFRPRVSKRDSAIALHALSCGVKGRPIKERSERETNVLEVVEEEKEKGKGGKTEEG